MDTPITVVSRKVLSWRLSNAMDARFCVEALGEALEKYGTPEIFNTDQGSQFTGEAFTRKLKENGIQISMGEKGRWVDNVFVERLWRSLKYEEVYLKAYDSPRQAEAYYGRFYRRVSVDSSISGREWQTVSNFNHVDVVARRIRLLPLCFSGKHC